MILMLAMPAGLALAQGCSDSGSAAMPDARYIALQNGTVYDQRTGLMWKQCPEGAAGIGCTAGEPLLLTLEEARRRAREWRFAGHADWRLPSQEELRSLLQGRCYGVDIDSYTFPRTPAGHFWTDDPASYYPGSAWMLDFGHGHLGYGTRRDRGYARLVREAGACSPVRPETCLPHSERLVEPHDAAEESGAADQTIP